MRLRSHLDLNTKALTWWVTPARTAGQEEGLWRIKQRFCFVTIVTEVQTGLLIKGKHDTIKFSLLISRKNKTKYEKHFFAQKVRSISLLASYPYYLDTHYHIFYHEFRIIYLQRCSSSFLFNRSLLFSTSSSELFSHHPSVAPVSINPFFKFLSFFQQTIRVI